MKNNQEITINQTQKLALTPDLLQSLAILQMPLLELETYLSRQLLDNCLLEQEEELFSDQDLNEFAITDPNETTETEVKSTSVAEDFLFEGEQPGEISRLHYSGKTYEIPSSSVLSLQEHLLSQLHMVNLPPKENMIAELLIDNIDADGHLRFDTREAAETFLVSPEVVANLLHLIQTFDPAGVGTRNIAECLLVQLKFWGDYPTGEIPYPKQLIDLAKTIIEEHLRDIADGRLSKISNRLKTSLQQIQSAVDLIRSLDPKPGRNFGSHCETRFITPDVTIGKIGNDYQITINEPENARLIINPFYRKFGSNKEVIDEDVVKFIKDQKKAALQLIKCIGQRKETLYQVTRSIIDRQKDFLENGIVYLKPLTLCQIAEAIGMHESTVSRAVAEKYLETPQGIYPFKFFLSTGIVSGNGNQIAAESVKKIIKTTVEGENPQSPLSDQQLMDLLKNKGVSISRRTVAKYREELKILSSDKRRRY